MGETKIGITVRYQETDRMGKAYHSNYLVWFEIARTELFKKVGASYASLEKEGYYLVVTEAKLVYKKPLTYEDKIKVRVRLSGIEKGLIMFDYDIAKDGVRAAEGSTKHVFVNEKGRPIRIPARVAKAFSRARYSTVS